MEELRNQINLTSGYNDIQEFGQLITQKAPNLYYLFTLKGAQFGVPLRYGKLLGPIF